MIDRKNMFNKICGNYSRIYNHLNPQEEKGRGEKRV